ncbi:MAG: UDP-glucose 4-epimerase GalE [Clostridium sp.]|nr:UDP-glucose 4-epimerase GalE [Clostridium sp.]
MILLTGGAGYIGSHTAVELIEAGYQVLIADNFYNSRLEVLDAIENITGSRPALEEIDVCDPVKVDEMFGKYPIEAVLHFASYKAVGESVEKPLMYYRNDLDSLLTVMEAMKKYQVNHLIFSSSATVYGVPETVPLVEGMPTGCTNPYGWTKYMSEQIIQDTCYAEPNLSAVILRYFNPIGAHKSALIGERPNGVPNNLMPYITQVASGIRPQLNVFGDDYDTPDGTGVRDYIHVVDIAKGHIAAVEYAKKHKGAEVINLGTGNGYSVLEIVKAFERVNDVPIPYKIAPRRAGDIAQCYADPSKAERLLGWKAKEDLDSMCRDAWKWEKNMEK